MFITCMKNALKHYFDLQCRIHCKETLVQTSRLHLGQNSHRKFFSANFMASISAIFIIFFRIFYLGIQCKHQGKHQCKFHQTKSLVQTSYNQLVQISNTNLFSAKLITCMKNALNHNFALQCRIHCKETVVQTSRLDLGQI